MSGGGERKHRGLAGKALLALFLLFFFVFPALLAIGYAGYGHPVASLRARRAFADWAEADGADVRIAFPRADLVSGTFCSTVTDGDGAAFVLVWDPGTETVEKRDGRYPGVPPDRNAKIGRTGASRRLFFL